MEIAEDICSQEEPFPLVEAKFRGERNRGCSGTPGRDLEEPVSQQPMEEGGGVLQGRPLGLRMQVSSICTRLC